MLDRLQAEMQCALEGQTQTTSRAGGTDFVSGSRKMRKDIMISGICALSLIMLTQNAYAQTYEKESGSGKVRFQCELEVPENWNGEEIPKFILESVHFVDSEKAYANFIEGKEILEKHSTPASDLYPEENHYVLADGTNPDFCR